MTMKSITFGIVLIFSSLLTYAHEVVRHPLPKNSTFPIALAVTVPAEMEITFHSGLLASPADPKADKKSRAYLGDTYTQTVSILNQLEDSLNGMGLDMGNVIKMTAYLTGDSEKGGQMDFGGFMKGYTQFFGTDEQPKLPARAALQVAGLARGAMIEIEVILAK